MRIFQNVGIYPSYAKRLAKIIGPQCNYEETIEEFLQDGFNAPHVLKGVLDKNENCFLSIGNFSCSQKTWASLHGLSKKSSREILLAQLEEHRAEVFYNLDPARFDDNILRGLPGCVKISIAWNASPTPAINFQHYDLVVNNFPALLRQYAHQGCNTAYFFPSLDPAMENLEGNNERPIDILFVGGFSRHHLRRTRILNAIAEMASDYTVRFNLDLGRINRFAETPILKFFGLFEQYSRTPSILAVSTSSIFGRELRHALRQSKIILNAAIDMIGNERGNIRCFEALGSGAVLLSDSGVYPEGMVPGKTLITYEDAADAVSQARRLLSDGVLRTNIATAGYNMASQRYSKAKQWEAFLKLASR